MKSTFIFAVLLTVSAAQAHASTPPAICLGKPAAWLKNVLYTVKQAHYKGVTVNDIQQTGNDYHDPVYEVTVSPGKTITVSCDDSGDGDCECGIGTN